MNIIKNIKQTSDITSTFTPFIVKCKTNSTHTHHLEHENGEEFNFYAVIHYIEKKDVSIDNIEKFIEDGKNFNKKSKKNRRQYFDLNASINFKCKINENDYIEINENFNSISSLARGMGIIVDCIKKNVLKELKLVFNFLKNEGIKNFTAPLNYLVNKGNFFEIGSNIKNRYSIDDINDISIEKIMKIDNKKGINGWTYILYQTNDNEWISLNCLFTREIRAGKEYLTEDKTLYPKLYDINNNVLHLNNYDYELKIKKIPFDNKYYLNKKGRYNKINKNNLDNNENNTSNNKKRKRDNDNDYMDDKNNKKRITINGHNSFELENDDKNNSIYIYNKDLEDTIDYELSAINTLIKMTKDSEKHSYNKIQDEIKMFFENIQKNFVILNKNFEELKEKIQTYF